MATRRTLDDRKPGNQEFFTGGVVQTTSLSEPEGADGVKVIAVEFPPGARSKWHSHPAGQVLHIVSGSGVVANDEGQVIRMVEGDTVTASAGELHWHGADRGSTMLQLSITTHGGADWADEVSDEEYDRALD
ncbi:MAG TPA: cupin domain-containing protein [Acidimicrobiia bacterium]|nr:cupin domain-containing protein [Acidimicrobiia bacterium]